NLWGLTGTQVTIYDYWTFNGEIVSITGVVFSGGDELGTLIFNSDDVSITNSTFNGFTAAYAAEVYGGSALYIDNVTFDENIYDLNIDGVASAQILNSSFSETAETAI